MTDPIRRNSLSWTLYASLGLFAFVQNMIAPAIPFLRDEFHWDYTLAAFHVSAFALGMIVSGFFADRVLKKVGFFIGLWGGLFGVFLGTLALVFSTNSAATLASILLMSITGTVALSAIQATISRVFPNHRSQALMEANMVASLTSVASPVMLLVGTATGIGWRILFPGFAVAFVCLFLLGMTSTKSFRLERTETHSTEKKPLGAAFWLSWLLIVFGVSVEWCVGVWAAEYLKGLPERSLELAAAGSGVFQASYLAGRFVSSRIARRWSERTILWAAIVLVVIGFPLYWIRVNVGLSYLGLALCGFGVCTFYPLALSLSIGASSGSAEKASSWGAIGAGVAIFSAPLLLGRVADAFSLSFALLAVPIGIVVMAVLLFLTRSFREIRVK